MAQAVLYQEGCSIDWVADAAYSAGDVIQLKDGRAAVISVDVASGDTVGVYVGGIFKIAKTANIVILTGGKVFWDYSASSATFKRVLDRDFYLGSSQEDASSSATTVKVALNVKPSYDYDMDRDAFLTTLVGTAAAGAFGYPRRMGGAFEFELTATSEAQKVDALAVDGFAIAGNAIVEAAFRVMSDGASGSQDITIGVASGTHASDFESVAEFVAIHLDGNDTKIYCESDDGTTDVAPVDSTKTYTEGSAVANRVEVWFDLRDPTDVQIYIDGVNVLPATTFTLTAATGPLYPIVHVEKASGTDVYKLAVDWLRARLSKV